jgi:uncharacterized protein (TIGR03382 family)
MRTSLLFAAASLTWLLSGPLVNASTVRTLVYITETGTGSFYITYDSRTCTDPKVIVPKSLFLCNFNPVDKSGGGSTYTPQKLSSNNYGVNPGDILLSEPGQQGQFSDLIRFAGTATDSNGKKLAVGITFYSVADDKDTDNSIDTSEPFNVVINGPCQGANDRGTLVDLFPANKACVIDEKDLSGESDVVSGTTINFDGKFTLPDGTKLPSLAGASGLAFTATGKNILGQDMTGGLPHYASETIRYIFVSDTDSEPTSTPEPGSTALSISGLTALSWVVRRRRRSVRPADEGDLAS